MTPRYPVMSAQHTVIPAKAGIHPSRRGAPCGRPSLRPLPLWGRLREGARRQARERPEGAASGFPTQRGPLRNPSPSVIPAKAGIHPSLRPLPLWGRLREGARRQARGRPEGAASGFPTQRGPLRNPPPSVIPAKAGIHPSRRGAPCGRPSLRPLPLWGRLREGARRQARGRPEGAASGFPTQRGPLRNPPPSVIPAKAGIPPSLRPLPLWGRLREGARRQARGRPKGASSGFPTQRRPLRNLPPSVIPAKAGIHPSKPTECD